MVKFSCSGFEDCLWHPCQLHWYSHRCASYRKRDFWKLYLWSSTSGPYLSFDHLDGLDGGFFILLKSCVVHYTFNVMMLLCSWLHDFAFFRRFLLIWWSTFHGHSSNLVVHAGCLPLPSTALRPHARRGVHGEGPLSSFFLVNGLAKISSQLNLYQVFFPATSGRVKSSEFSVAKIHEFPMVFFYRKPVGGGVGRWLSLLYFQDERGCHWCGGRCYEFHLRIFGWLWLRILHWNSIWSWKLKTMVFVHIMYSRVSSWRSSK